jgi:hypothetical protein
VPLHDELDSQRQPRTARPSGGHIDDLTVAAGRAAAERRSGSVGLAVENPVLEPVGAENWSASCDLGILVDQPAESIEPYDLCVDEWSGRGNGSQRWRLAERAVRPVVVVVCRIARQRPL